MGYIDLKELMSGLAIITWLFLFWIILVSYQNKKDIKNLSKTIDHLGLEKDLVNELVEIRKTFGK